MEDGWSFDSAGDGFPTPTLAKDDHCHFLVSAQGSALRLLSKFSPTVLLEPTMDGPDTQSKHWLGLGHHLSIPCDKPYKCVLSVRGHR